VSAAPAVVRWPGVIKPGTVINDIFSHLDWMPTIMAAVGEPDIKEKLLKGHKADGKKFKVHLDGYDQTALLKGEGPGARKEIFYITHDGNLSAFRYGKWKIVFTQQKATGIDVWREEFVPTRWPLLVDLHADPFERAMQEGRPGHGAGRRRDPGAFGHCHGRFSGSGPGSRVRGFATCRLDTGSGPGGRQLDRRHWNPDAGLDLSRLNW